MAIPPRPKRGQGILATIGEKIAKNLKAAGVNSKIILECTGIKL